MEPLPTLTKETREWCVQNGLPMAETVTDVIAAAERGAERSNPSSSNGNITVQDTQAIRFVQAIDSAIERANRKAISGAQRIQKWAILPIDLSIPGGELGN
jgi:long-chain-fatty-acid--CoA ligase ACSBG